MSDETIGKKTSHHDEMSMSCRELFERLSEYVDGDLPPNVCVEIQRHMADCAPCVAFANTLKKTADLCRRLPSKPMPPEVADNLRAFLAAYLSEPK